MDKLTLTRKNKVIHFRMPEPIYKMVEDVAKDNNCTNSEVVRALLLEKFLSVNRINTEQLNDKKEQQNVKSKKTNKKSFRQNSHQAGG